MAPSCPCCKWQISVNFNGDYTCADFCNLICQKIWTICTSRKSTKVHGDKKVKNVCVTFRARKNSSPRRNPYGVTLVELMVVIVILGLLAGLITPRVLTHIATARVATCKTQIQFLHDAVNNYYLDTGEYPTALEDLINDPGVEGWRVGGYLEQASEIPTDPWGNDFGYDPQGNMSPDFDIYSYGKDGQEGGEGDDADIYNIDLGK